MNTNQTPTDTIEPPAQLELVSMREIEMPTISPEMFDALPDMQEGFSLQSAYLKFENEGDKHRAFFVGWSEMRSPTKNENIPAAVFLWKDPETGSVKRVINAGDNLCKQLQNLPFQQGDSVPVEIRYLGLKKSNGGKNYKSFDVIVLNGVTRKSHPLADAAAQSSQPVNIPALRAKIEAKAEEYKKTKRDLPEPTDTALFLLMREASGNDEARHALNIALTGYESYTKTPAHFKLAMWDYLKPYKNGDGKYHINAEVSDQLKSIIAEFTKPAN